MEDGKVVLVRVDMGEPEPIAEKIPLIADSEKVIDAPIEIDGTTYHMTCVSMGNPHCVVFMDDVENFEIEKQVRYLKIIKIFQNGSIQSL